MKKINAIYIIDDDPITVFGIRKMLNSVVICNAISTFGNGKLALDDIVRIIEKGQRLPEVNLSRYKHAHYGWMAVSRRIHCTAPERAGSS